MALMDSIVGVISSLDTDENVEKQENDNNSMVSLCLMLFAFYLDVITELHFQIILWLLSCF